MDLSGCKRNKRAKPPLVWSLSPCKASCPANNPAWPLYQGASPVPSFWPSLTFLPGQRALSHPVLFPIPASWIVLACLTIYIPLPYPTSPLNLLFLWRLWWLFPVMLCPWSPADPQGPSTALPSLHPLLPLVLRESGEPQEAGTGQVSARSHVPAMPPHATLLLHLSLWMC